MNKPNSENTKEIIGGLIVNGYGAVQNKVGITSKDKIVVSQFIREDLS